MGIEWYLNIEKAIYEKFTENTILNGGKLQALPLRSGSQGCSLSSISFNIVLDVLEMSEKKKK